MKRTVYKVVKKRLEEPRKFIQVLFGPRQVGKTFSPPPMILPALIPNGSEQLGIVRGLSIKRTPQQIFC